GDPCSATAPVTSVGSSANLAAVAPGAAGNATFTCNAGGTWSASPNPGATCNCASGWGFNMKVECIKPYPTCGSCADDAWTPGYPSKAACNAARATSCH